jgi:cytochrome P450
MNTSFQTPPFSQEPALLSSLRFARDPLGRLETLRARLGHVFGVDLAFRRVCVMGSPEGVRHILQTNNRNYTKDESYQQLKLLLGNGLLTNEGDSWLRQRRLAQPAFYKESLREIFSTMGTVSREFAEKLSRHQGSPVPLDMNRELMAVTIDIVLCSLFSYPSSSASGGDLYDAMHFLQEYVIKRIREPYKIPWMYLSGEQRRYRRNKREMDQLVGQIIEQRRSSGQTLPDLLGMFMAARDEETGEGMGEQQLIDECLTMIAAGHETSANGLTWALYALSAHPEIRDRIREEADRVIGRSGIPSFEQIADMHYTRMVVEEAMRLYPPAWVIGRKAIADDVADGWQIPKGQIVLIPVYLIHRDPALWDQPDLFRPERFSPEAAKARHKFAYLPFGGGPRLCIGYQFALMEMQLLLAMIYQQVDLVNDPSHAVVKQPLVTLKPKTGVQMFVR